MRYVAASEVTDRQIHTRRMTTVTLMNNNYSIKIWWKEYSPMQQMCHGIFDTGQGQEIGVMKFSRTRASGEIGKNVLLAKMSMYIIMLYDT